MNTLLKYSPFLMCLLLASTGIYAQATEGIPYQAIARNSSGALLASHAISVRFSIHDSVATGSIIYQETFSPTTTAQGLFNVNVGMGSASIGSFSSINWGVNAKFMQVELDPTGGTSYMDMGTTQMMSVPYALYSSNGLPAGTAGDMLYFNGSEWVRVPVGSNGQILTTLGGVPSWQTSTCFLPSLITSNIVNLTSISAVCGGNIVNSGNGNITTRGVCWDTSPYPTTLLSTKTTDSSGQGSFNTNITGLTAGTTYYLRAYASNSFGTSYGNQIVFSTPLSIGANYRGGIIAYILRSGDPGYDSTVPHGLIVAPTDQSTGHGWGYVCGGCTLGGTSSSIGTGAINTSIIVSAWGYVTAAYICVTLTLGGYDDWYLPSKDELNKIFLNKTSSEGFSGASYWSSTEYVTSAWYQSFYDGYVSFDSHNTSHYVRAVRSF